MKDSFKALAALTALLAISCAAPPEPMDEAPPVDLVAETAAAAAVVDQFAQIWITEDMDLASQIFAQGAETTVIGTDLAEMWTGYDTFRSSLETQFAAYEDTELSTENQFVKVHASGEVAWFWENADWHVTAGGERVEVNDMRITGVLEKQGGAWKIVQMHLSVPVSGQVVAY